MKTYNYTLNRIEDNHVKKYYENTSLILEIYALVKKEHAIVIPRIPKNDERNKVIQHNGAVYYMKSSQPGKHIINKIPSLKQLISKVAAVFF
ncbi:hypothetical protein BH10BAC2_BH10BAC2_35370 [soil metagenome]